MPSARWHPSCRPPIVACALCAALACFHALCGAPACIHRGFGGCGARGLLWGDMPASPSACSFFFCSFPFPLSVPVASLLHACIAFLSSPRPITPLPVSICISLGCSPHMFCVWVAQGSRTVVAWHRAWWLILGFLFVGSPLRVFRPRVHRVLACATTRRTLCAVGVAARPFTSRRRRAALAVTPPPRSAPVSVARTGGASSTVVALGVVSHCPALVAHPLPPEGSTMQRG